MAGLDFFVTHNEPLVGIGHGMIGMIQVVFDGLNLPGLPGAGVEPSL